MLRTLVAHTDQGLFALVVVIDTLKPTDLRSMSRKEADENVNAKIQAMQIKTRDLRKQVNKNSFSTNTLFVH